MTITEELEQLNVQLAEIQNRIRELKNSSLKKQNLQTIYIPSILDKFIYIANRNETVKNATIARCGKEIFTDTNGISYPICYLNGDGIYLGQPFKMYYHTMGTDDNERGLFHCLADGWFRASNVPLSQDNKTSMFDFRYLNYNGTLTSSTFSKKNKAQYWWNDVRDGNEIVFYNFLPCFKV